ncbi:MAG: M15 family metallopeptidase, partial [Bacteroidota bacterium]
MQKLGYYFIPFLCFISCQNNEKASSSIQSLPIVKNAPIEKSKAITYDYDTTMWTDIAHLDSTILLDLKYATTDNFVQEKMYECGRCFLRPTPAKLIAQAHQQLQKQGLGLKLFDCYRPRPIQEKLWKKVPNASYVTPPWKGSMHNRGAAIDLTIVDKAGKELDMGTPFDFFGQEAHHTYTKHSSEVTANRKLLRDLMESLDLKTIRTEWWQYSYRRVKYEIGEMLWDFKNYTMSL